MFDYKGNLRRLKLFKELEPDFKIDKVFYLTEPLEYDFKYIDIGDYIVSKPFVSSQKGHRMYISARTYNQDFTCWRIKENDFKKQFKTIPFRNSHNFLYKGEKNG